MASIPANRLMIRDSYRWIVIVGGTLLLSLAALALARAAMGAPPAPARLPWIVWAHVALILPAVPIGMWLILNPKGTRVHRLLGRVWIGLMLASAALSFGIRISNDGRLSFIHILSAYVLVASVLAIRAAVQGRIAAHSGTVWGLFFGGLLVAGLATFVPGRLMWAWAFRGW